MEQEHNSFELLFEKTCDYLDTRIELTKLKAVDKTSDLISSLTTRLIIFFLLQLYYCLPVLQLHF